MINTSGQLGQKNEIVVISQNNGKSQMIDQWRMNIQEPNRNKWTICRFAGGWWRHIKFIQSLPQWVANI